VLVGGCATSAQPAQTPGAEPTSTAPAPDSGNAGTPDAGTAGSETEIALTPTLREVAPAGFYVGTIAQGGGQMGRYWPYLTMPPLREIISTQFNSITGENQAKWNTIHPRLDAYNFDDMDAMVDFAEENGMRVRGHTLLWHRDLPGWVFSLSDDDLRAVLEDHIKTTVGRYQGRIAQWDVANEVIDDNGQWRSENPWIDRLGPDIIADAFRWAHEADPNAKLYLNDYSVEWDNAKWQKYTEYLPELVAAGAPIDGFGFQGHIDSDSGFPTALGENMQFISDLGLDSEITELDIRFPVDGDGQATAADLAQQAEWFEQAYATCLENARCTGVTLWGVGDYFSWVSNEFPGWGAATPFDRQLQPKPSFTAIRAALSSGRP
jgi:endo-1,4-beta-xylanase